MFRFQLLIASFSLSLISSVLTAQTTFEIEDCAQQSEAVSPYCQVVEELQQVRELSQSLQQSIDDLQQEVSARSENVKNLESEFEITRDFSSQILTWTGFVFGALALLVTVAALLGIREISALRRFTQEARSLQEDSEKLKKTLASTSEEFERESQTLMSEISKLKDEFAADAKTLVHVAFTASEARNAFHRGDYSRCIELNKTVLSYKPNDADALCYIGRSLVYLGDAPKALEAFNTILNLHEGDHECSPEKSAAYFGIASSLRFSDLDGAIEAAERSKACDPGNHAAIEFLGVLYRDGGRHQESYAAFDEAYRLKPESDGAMFLSTAYQIRGNTLEAERYRELARVKAEEDVEAGYRLIWSYMTLWFVAATKGDLETATDFIKKLEFFRVTEYRAQLIQANLKHVAAAFSLGDKDAEHYLSTLHEMVGPAAASTTPHLPHVTDDWLGTST